MSKSALILLDLQNLIVEHLKDGKSSYLARVSEAIKASRAAGIHLIYVKTCFRPGHPEVSKRNFSFAKLASYGGAFEGDASTEISSEVAPIEGDVIVTKRRVSAFSGSDLDCVLRGIEVDSLVLTGLAASGAVLSTFRFASDLDYRISVVSDLCYDLDPEVHQVLIEKVFIPASQCALD
jgi:nicotinamidase-related amidase